MGVGDRVKTQGTCVHGYVEHIWYGPETDYAMVIFDRTEKMHAGCVRMEHLEVSE